MLVLMMVGADWETAVRRERMIEVTGRGMCIMEKVRFLRICVVTLVTGGFDSGISQGNVGLTSGKREQLQLKSYYLYLNVTNSQLV